VLRSPLLALLLSSPVFAQATAAFETSPVAGGPGESASDPAIWVNPIDPSRSLVLGTDRLATPGLHSYGLDGGLVQSIGELTASVDVRNGYALGGVSIPLVATTQLATMSVGLFTINSATLAFSNVGAPFPTGKTLASAALYVTPVDGGFQLFTSDTSGNIDHYELFNDGGTVDLRALRTFAVGGAVDGLVADDRTRALYVSQRDLGAIWRYGAEADAGSERTLFAQAPDAGLTAPVTGLAIYPVGNAGGWLLASSRGNSSFAALPLAAGGRSAVFTVAGELTIDGVTGTHGIAVTASSMGSTLSRGLFVAHDAFNDTNPNYKAVPWERISALGLDAPLPDAGAGSEDGGGGNVSLPGGSGPVVDPGPPSPCACSSGGAGLLSLGLLALATWNRSRR
jgi:myo-inositol-hexaphosphate 3-phosphohydrolase